MKTVLTKVGFVYSGKLIEWDAFYEVLASGIPDQKTMDRIKKKLKDAIDFLPLSVEQNNNLNEIAEILNLKLVDNDRILKGNILKKIRKFEEDYS